MTPGARLRQLIAGPELLVVPGCHDLLSLLVAERAAARAHYMSGYGVSVSLLGRPDAGLATYTEFVGRVAAMAEVATVPIIADADTGFGGLLNVARTVAGYERAGAAAIQIEDQEAPKKCGHVLGRRVVALEEMVLRLRVAVDTRTDPGLVLVARTDARTEHGLDEAIRRAEAYVNAGADVIFVESPESAEELARIGSALGGVPLLANMVPGASRTPVLPAGELKKLGFSLAIYPSISLMASGAAMRTAVDYLLQTGSTIGYEGALLSSDESHELAGFSDVHAFDRRWALGA